MGTSPKCVIRLKVVLSHNEKDYDDYVVEIFPIAIEGEDVRFGFYTMERRATAEAACQVKFYPGIVTIAAADKAEALVEAESIVTQHLIYNREFMGGCTKLTVRSKEIVPWEDSVASRVLAVKDMDTDRLLQRYMDEGWAHL